MISKKRLSNYIMYSGGATGSDRKWEEVGRLHGLTDVRHYWHGQKTPFGNVKLTDAEIEVGWQHVLEANKKLKRKPEAYKSLLSRNWFQVAEAEALFAVASIDFALGQVRRGTGWAVQMAIDINIPVYVFEQGKHGWYKYYYPYGEFVRCDVPNLTKRFGAVGTRDLQPNGIEAIVNIYQQAY